MGVFDFVKNGVREMMIARPDHLKSLIVFKHASLQSPILESSTSKGEVRLLAKELGLPNWERSWSDGTARTIAHKAELARKFLVSIGFKDVSLIVHGKRMSI